MPKTSLFAGADAAFAAVASRGDALRASRPLDSRCQLGPPRAQSMTAIHIVKLTERGHGVVPSHLS